MSGGSERISHLPVSTHHDPAAAHAAGQVVLHRAVDGRWTRQQILDVMEALGLVDYLSGGRTDVLGGRASLSAGEQRRRAETSTPTVPHLRSAT